MMAPDPALCLEQTLGHRAHTLNLERAAALRGRPASVVRVAYPEGSRVALPWAVRGSGRALRQLRTLARRPDATLFHTSTISLGAPAFGTPYVVSVDATPLQVDAMGDWYRHKRSARAVERAKVAWYRRVFGGARAMVAWSEWSARSLERDYGVRPDRIRVFHPGAGRPFFELERLPARDIPTILFVGGDFVRKGGDVLLEAFAPLSGRARLLLVTGADIPDMPEVAIERGATPGSERLLAAYAGADIFCLPTRGDCTSVAIEEAMAAGLPVVTTPVGSNPETVADGESGFLVPVDNVAALREALTRLVDDASTRTRMGTMAREHARESYDADANARGVLALLQDVA